MKNELEKIDDSTKKVIQSTEALEEKYSDVKVVLQEIQKLIEEGNYSKVKEEYSNLLKYNENAARELEELQNERINLTGESLGIFRAILDGEFSYIMDLILDTGKDLTEKGTEALLEFFGKTKIEAEMWSKNISAAILGGAEAFWTSFKLDYDPRKWGISTEKRHEAIAESFLRGFTRSITEDADQSKKIADQTLEDLKSITKEKNESLKKLNKEGTIAQQQQKEELAAAEAQRLAEEQARAQQFAQVAEDLRKSQVEGVQAAAAAQADVSIIQKGLAEQSAALTATTTATEGKSLKERIQQWKEYGEKVSAISNKVSEVTGIVTNSLGSMFSQLSASYTQELEEINEKIAALDEEKEVALESVALTEDERAAREEELEEQRMNSLYAITYEEKAKADERIAILQGELNAEDTVNREFESKKAELEKEKEEKEKARKQAEKQQKRLEMGQSIVEATGNIAKGVACSRKLPICVVLPIYFFLSAFFF